MFFLTLALFLFQAQPPPEATLEGIVLNSVTGQAIPNVTISAPGGLVAGRQQNQSVRTDSDGRFRLTGLTPNFHYYLTARKRGYFGDLAGGEFASTQVAPASPAAPTPPVSFRLIPQAIISGRVVDEYGEPVQGATVQAGRLLRPRGQPSYKTAGSSPITNDKGEFRITGLLPGSYYLLVRYDDLDNLSAGPASTAGNYLPTYFPGTGTLLAAQPLTLTAGLELPGIEFKLKRERVFNISGRVQGLEPDSRSMPSVELLPQDPLFAALRLPQRGGMMRPNGEFEILAVAPGAYTLIATFRDGQKTLQGNTPVVVTQSDVTGIQVAFAPAPEMTGRLILEGPGIEQVDWTKFRVMLESPGAYTRAGLAATAADGSFRQTYELPGSYILNINGPAIPNAYLDSVRVGSTEYLGKLIDFTAGPPGPIRVIYRTSPGEIRGQLETAEPLKPNDRTGILLLPADPQLRFPPFARYTMLAGPGKFAFTLVRPDDYLLLAFPGRLLQDYLQGAELPPDLEKAATRLHVEPNGKYDVQVKLNRAAGPSVN